VQQIVDAAPPLTDAQRHLLATLAEQLRQLTT
jgi:hypothetical protein